jgi:tungstate transport system substrate-binding protein
LVTARRVILGTLFLLAAFGAHAQERYIVVASTTSTEQSGLFGAILPAFEKDTGIKVRVVALGTGQALDVGRRGDADVVFVHARAAEEKFVAEGHGVKRFPVMYNDYVLIGPKGDPAKVAGGKDILAAFRKIRAAQVPFVSRGDKSGTHMAERELWKASGVDLDKAKGPWYRDTGQGMGPALNTAASMNAYLLADRGTWLAFRNRGDLAILVEGDRRLVNQYGVIPVNPERHPNVKKDTGQRFVDWLVSPAGQKAIANYRIDGEQLFFPNAEQAGASIRASLTRPQIPPTSEPWPSRRPTPTTSCPTSIGHFRRPCPTGSGRSLRCSACRLPIPNPAGCSSWAARVGTT